MRHKHRHEHKHKHKTTSISYGITKANSFSFVFVNLTGKFILCYFAYAYVASENHAGFIENLLTINPNREFKLQNQLTVHLIDDFNRFAWQIND